MSAYKISNRCIMDTSDPDITFDPNGVCNHCHNYDRNVRLFGYKGRETDEKCRELIASIKECEKDKEYDCILGISGGVDSAYMANKLGLRVLAVHIDAGWNTEREVMAYVTSSNGESGFGWLFFNTIFPSQIQLFCAWQEKELLNRTGSEWMQYIPLFLYSFCWNIEVSYYEQKSFWSSCGYMVCSRKGIEMLVNLINISYCATKLFPYKEEAFSQYQSGSSQEFRFFLSEQIRWQVFYGNLVKNIGTHIKSKRMFKALKQLCLNQIA